MFQSNILNYYIEQYIKLIINKISIVLQIVANYCYEQL